MGNKQNKRGKGADRTKHDAPDRNRWVKHELDENDIHPPRKTKKRPSKTSRKSITTSPQSIDDLYEADRQLRSQITGRPLAETIDVHTCYQEAVQLPAAEVENLINMYAEAQTSFGKPDEFGQFRKPLLLREDFCGTAILCRAFCKSHVQREAYGVDLDPSVIEYAKTVTLNEGPESERVKVTLGNVLSTPEELGVPKVDITAGLNYGCFYFKKRRDLVKYLTNARMGLREGGCLIVDVLGGASVTSIGGTLNRRNFGKFDYFFEQKPFEATANTARVHLHFRFEDGSWLKNAFQYDFRAYTIIEIKEAMLDAGFRFTQTWVAGGVEQEEAEESDEEEDAGEENDDEDNRSIERKRTSKESNGIHEYRKLEGPMSQLESYNGKALII